MSSPNPKESDKRTDRFKALINDREMVFQLLDLHPAPVLVFAPDGLCIFINRAGAELCNITDVTMFAGKYNLKSDPVCTEICGRGVIDKIFRGESFSVPNFFVPAQGIKGRGNDENFSETANVFILPIWDNDEFICAVMFYNVENAYSGIHDAAKAQAYLDAHWKDEYDPDEAARSAGLNRRHFIRVFKENMNCTPLEYHIMLKIEKIKEKLLDKGLSVEQAFEACGADYKGTYFKYFKDITGLPPSEYRRRKMIK